MDERSAGLSARCRKDPSHLRILEPPQDVALLLELNFDAVLLVPRGVEMDLQFHVLGLVGEVNGAALDIRQDLLVGDLSLFVLVVLL